MKASRVRVRAPVTDKRDAILAASIELFNERTFDGTPMPLVAERAGVGAGTIYRYFENKEALGNAVFRECKLAMQSFLSEGARANLSAREEFHALWRGLWEFSRQRPAAFRFLETHQHASYLDDASRTTSEAVFRHVTDFVRRGQGVGALRRLDPAVLIALAFGAFIGLVKESDEGRLTLTEDVVAASEEAVWTMLRR